MRTSVPQHSTRAADRWLSDVAFFLVGFLTIFLFLSPDSAVARQLNEAETASLTEAVATFDAAMRANDFATIVKTIPPRVLEHIAKGAGVGVDELRAVIVNQMEEVLTQVTLNSFGMDLAKAEHRELADGTPYVLIPTETVMTVDESKMSMRSHTLALLDGAVWYLVRVSEVQQLEILRQVYPEYVDVEFPLGSMEALSK